MRVPRFRRTLLLACAAAVGVLGAAVEPALATHDGTKYRITLKPESSTNTVGEQHCVTATVRDTGHGGTSSGHQAVVGAIVRFSVTGANSASGFDVTDTGGEATFCYIGTEAGEDLIAAYVDRNANGVRDEGETIATAKKTYKPGRTAVVELEPVTATNEVGERHCVTATATDLYGNPTPGVTLLFAVTGANPTSGTAVTDTSGQATVCYTGTNAGVDTITAVADLDRSGSATAGEPVGTATKIYIRPGPSTLTLAPAVATNTVGEQHCVTATARGPLGEPAAGVTIVFSVTGANPQTATTRTTDASGQATFCYTGTNAGLDVINAFADTDRDGRIDVGEPVAAATKTYLPGAPTTVVVTPPTAENVVGTQHCVMATVTDAFGNRVPDAKVIFAVTGANAAGGTATTDANGNATFCYTGTKSGLDTITATADTNGNASADVGEPSGVATKLYHPGAPAAVAVTPATAVNEAGEQHCVTATVTDQFGNPVGAGVAVFFTVAGANPQATAKRTTDAAGQATFCYTGTRAGEDAITAVADANGNGQLDVGEPTGVATKTYRPGPPANIALEPKEATNVAGEEHCLTATVTDRFGNPTPGIAVDFTVTGANAGGGVAVTNLEGKARFCYTGTKAGTDTITATVAGTTLSATATKTYRPGPPALVDMNPAAATNRAGEQHCVTATVTDRFGNPAGAGFAVIFSVAGANPQPPTVKTTDANSQAQFCYTGTKAGIDTITAVVDTNGNGVADAGEPTGVATKTYLPGPPATLVLSPKTATNVVGEKHCVTATVTDQFGNRTPGVTVRFTVAGSVATSGDSVQVGASGSETTDGRGEATFCYTSDLPGENVITAFADTNDNGVQDAGEPADVATKTYVLPPSTPGCEVKVTNGGWFTTVAGDKATFGGNAKVSESGVVSGQETYQDHGPLQPLTLHSIEVQAVVCTASRTHAIVYGVARVENVEPFHFRIEVTDAGEPGLLDTYSMLISNGYYSGERRLEGGNVQIH